MLLAGQLHAQQLGLELYSFRNQFAKDVPGTLDLIKNMGFTVVEGGGSYGMPLAEFAAALKERGISVVSIGADYNELQNNLDSVILKAKTYGAKYVVCFWIPHNGNQFSIEEIRNAIQVFNTAGKTLSENGLQFCYHPHGYEFRPYNKGTLFDELIAGLNPAYANFEMDVYWIKHPGQDPVALLKKYPNRFKLLHLKDRQKGTPGNQDAAADVETNVVLGTGDVDIAGVIRQARKNRIEYMFIEDESSRSVEQVPKSAAFVKTIR